MIIYEIFALYTYYFVSAFVLLHNLVLTEITRRLCVARCVTHEFVGFHPEQKRDKRNGE